MRNVTFLGPSILWAEDTVIKVEVRDYGDGLSHPLDGIDVSLEPSHPAKILRVESTPGDECGWCLNSFSPALGFVAPVVTENRKR